MEDVFDSPDYPRFQSTQNPQISPVLKNTLFRSRATDIPYEAWDSIDRCSPVHIEGLHRLVMVAGPYGYPSILRMLPYVC